MGIMPGAIWVCCKCQRGRRATCPSVWANLWKRFSLRLQCPAAGNGLGRDAEDPSRAAGRIIIGALAESSFPPQSYGSACNPELSWACRCPIPQEKGDWSTPTVVAGDKNRYTFTDSFNRKSSRSPCPKRVGDTPVCSGTTAWKSEPLREARGRGRHAPQLVPDEGCSFIESFLTGALYHNQSCAPRGRDEEDPARLLSECLRGLVVAAFAGSNLYGQIRDLHSETGGGELPAGAALADPGKNAVETASPAVAVAGSQHPCDECCMTPAG